MAALTGEAAARAALAARPRRWLVTGSAGFIGSHLLEKLLQLGQAVVSLDNFATGHRRNLEDVRARVDKAAWARHRFVEADLADFAACRDACAGVDVVLHQAALGSVPRSIDDPRATHAANATGFLNILEAARTRGVRRFVYASSSSVYGDDAELPKIEARTGRPLSPYAVTKCLDELYAEVFARAYGMQTIGLRYFNVFGPRQDPEGPYAAVIPRWAGAMAAGEACVIHGDGKTSRDFCYIDSVVQANLLAATVEDPAALGQVYNVAYGESTSLRDLHGLLAAAFSARRPGRAVAPPEHGPFRAGDVRHSLADTAKARRLLGYAPTHSVRSGIEATMDWYVEALARTGGCKAA